MLKQKLESKSKSPALSPSQLAFPIPQRGLVCALPDLSVFLQTCMFQ